MDRRSFLRSLAALPGAALAGAWGLVALRFLRPAGGPPGGGIVRCGAAARFRPGEVRAFPEPGLFVVRLPEGLLGLSARCTHLDCRVPWNPATRRFVCPCHAGAFDERGERLSGPPKRPLDAVPLSLKRGEVVADLAATYARPAGFSRDQVLAVPEGK